MEIFEYAFMRRAFAAGLLLALIVPCIGVIMVFKRLSMVGNALSHTSLTGVAIGLLFGFNPIVGALGANIIAAMSIEAIRKRIPRYSEMSIAIILSAGIGLAGVLSGFVESAASFNSFLFGSIVAIQDMEMAIIAGISLVVLTTFLLLYKELFFISYDEQAARIAGVPVRTINTIFTLLTAVTVSIATRTVGALIVSSLMVVPVACAMTLARSYRQTVIYSILFALFFTATGLYVAYYERLRPGGTIVLVGVITLLLLLLGKGAAKRFRRKTESIKNET